MWQIFKAPLAPCTRKNKPWHFVRRSIISVAIKNKWIFNLFPFTSSRVGQQSRKCQTHKLLQTLLAFMRQPGKAFVKMNERMGVGKRGEGWFLWFDFCITTLCDFFSLSQFYKCFYRLINQEEFYIIFFILHHWKKWKVGIFQGSCTFFSINID